MKSVSALAMLLVVLAAAPSGQAPLPRLEACGRFFCRADTGAVADYREVSAFALYARWLAGERAHVTGYARAMRAEGVTALRVILTLGGPFWDARGLHVGPDLGERFYGELPGFVDAIGREGLYVRLTLIGALEPLGGSVPDRGGHYTRAVDGRARAMAARVVGLTSSRAHVLYEVANEWDHIGMAGADDEVVGLGRLIAAAAPGSLLNLSNTSGAIAGETTWARPPADFVDVHLPRRRGQEGFAWLVDVADLPVVSRPRMPVLSGEPINFGTSGVGGADDHEPSPAVACAYGAVSRVAQFYTTFHYDGGLWADLPDETTMTALRAWQRCLEAIPFALVGPGTERCDARDACTPLSADARAAAADQPLATRKDRPLHLIGRTGPGGYVGVSLREPAGWDGRAHLAPGMEVEELARVEYAGWGTVIRLITQMPR
ncbi:MAG: hypothetical protein AB7N90_13080 [Vicinamibacterales bacterium]